MRHFTLSLTLLAAILFVHAAPVLRRDDVDGLGTVASEPDTAVDTTEAQQGFAPDPAAPAVDLPRIATDLSLGVLDQDFTSNFKRDTLLDNRDDVEGSSGTVASEPDTAVPTEAQQGFEPDFTAPEIDSTSGGPFVTTNRLSLGVLGHDFTQIFKRENA